MKVDKQKLEDVYTTLEFLHNTLSGILDNPLLDSGGNADCGSDTVTDIYYYELHELKLVRYVLDSWNSRQLHDLVLSKRFHVLGVNFDEGENRHKPNKK